MASISKQVVKLGIDGEDAIEYAFFINGKRSEAYSETALLMELLGDNYREIWITEPSDYTQDQRDALTTASLCDTIEEVEQLMGEYPEMFEET